MKALTKFWQGQGSMGRKMLAKYQPFESIRLTSGMPPFSSYHFWAAVMALGGHSVVSFSFLDLLFFVSFFFFFFPFFFFLPPLLIIIVFFVSSASSSFMLFFFSLSFCDRTHICK